MYKTGEAPVNFTLLKYDTASYVSLADYTGKDILLSFVNIDTGWSWLTDLIAIQNDPSIVGLSSETQIIAVVYRFLGSVDAFGISDKIDTDPSLSGKINYAVLVDNGWSAGSIASQYINGFAPGVDPDFFDATSTITFSYIISKDYKIVDKWQNNGTAVNDPISFEEYSFPGIPPFDTTDWVNAVKYIVQRLVNIAASPKILSTTPPQLSTVSTVNTVKVVFSKLMSDTAGTTSGYALGGSASGLSLTSASFTGGDRVKNVATLTLSGTPTGSGSLVITATAAITDTAGTPLPAGSNTINYTIDITPPTVTLSSSPVTPTSGDVTITAAISDTSGIAVQKYASGNQPISFFATGGTVLSGTTILVSVNGTYTVYAKDNAGNETVQTISITNIDKIAPQAFTTGAVVTLGGAVKANYWNAGNTSVQVTVPIDNDMSLINGSCKVRANLDGGSWIDLGSPVTLSALDLGAVKNINIPKSTLESMSGFAEGRTIHFDAIIADAAANSTTGGDSATTLFIDRVAPTINSGTVAADNGSVTVNFSEGVYASASGGALAAASLSLTFSQNGGTATGAFISTVSHTAGNTSALVVITVTGTPSGVETITIKPSGASSVYDAAGNPALASTSTGALALKDKVAPLVTSFTTSTPSPTMTSPINISIQGTDAIGVVAWAVTESASAPASGWTTIASSAAPTIAASYALTVSGTKILYAWLKDAAGNVSVMSATSHLEITFGKNPFTGVVLRDYIGDTGDVPTSGTVCASPDIIDNGTSPLVSPATPASSFPAYSSPYGSNQVTAGVINYFYARTKNLGAALADGQAEVFVYYTESSLLMNPASWITRPMTVTIGGVDQNNNPLPASIANDVVFPLNPFKWTPVALPAGQHYCLIGVVSAPQHRWDPANPPLITSVGDFGTFVEYNPNICWKNVTLADAKKSQKQYIRQDLLNNDWKDDLPVMVQVQVRNVPVGTVINIQNKEIGIDLKHIVERTDDVVYTPGAVLKGNTKSAVTTTVQIPANANWAQGAQITTTAYAGVRSHTLEKAGITVKLGVALELENVKKTLALTERLGKGMTKTDGDAPAGFVVTGTCSTLFFDPEISKLPVLNLKPVPVMLPKPVIEKPRPVNVHPGKPIFGRMTDIVKKAFAAKPKPVKAVSQSPAKNITQKPVVKKPVEAISKSTTKKVAGKISKSPKKIVKKAVVKKPVGAPGRASSKKAAKKGTPKKKK